MFETLYRWIFVPRNPRRTTKWAQPQHSEIVLSYKVWEQGSRDFRWSVSYRPAAFPEHPGFRVAEGQATCFSHAKWDAEDAVRELQDLTAKANEPAALRSEVDRLRAEIDYERRRQKSVTAHREAAREPAPKPPLGTRPG